MFFSYCAQRAKRPPPAMQSIVEMQVEQILFPAAKNPSMPQLIMPLPRVERASMEPPNVMVSPPRLPKFGMTPQMLKLQTTENPGMQPQMIASSSACSPKGVTPSFDSLPLVRESNLHPNEMLCGPAQGHAAQMLLLHACSMQMVIMSPFVIVLFQQRLHAFVHNLTIELVCLLSGITSGRNSIKTCRFSSLTDGFK